MKNYQKDIDNFEGKTEKENGDCQEFMRVMRFGDRVIIDGNCTPKEACIMLLAIARKNDVIGRAVEIAAGLAKLSDAPMAEKIIEVIMRKYTDDLECSCPTCTAERNAPNN